MQHPHPRIRETDYTFDTLLKTDEAKQEAKKEAESNFYPQLKVVIEYPWISREQEDFFNSRDELSGIVLLEKNQAVCKKIAEDNNKYIPTPPVTLGELMLQGAKDQNEYYFRFGLELGSANNFISLNQYLIVNGLRNTDHYDDGRRRGSVFSMTEGEPIPDGVKKILTVGAAK